MTRSSTILQELTELNSPLTEITPQNTMQVPDGYFEGLAGQLLNRVKALEANSPAEELSILSPLLSGISKEMPFSLPAGYFENLEVKAPVGNEYSGVEELSPSAEIKLLSPFLSGLKKDMPFSVPQGYFETLSAGNKSEKDLAPVIAFKSAKVVSLTHRKWFRLAAAAVIAGVIGLSAFLYFNGRESYDPVKSFAKLDNKIEKEIKKTSDKDLTEFAQQFSIADVNVGLNDPKADSKVLLKDVPDTDLKEFLQDTSDTDADDAGSPSLMN